MSFAKRNIELLILLITIAIVIIWQLFFIIQLPDGDTDAYAHFIIARDIVKNPYNLSSHWVWLPLFHYIGAFFVFIGIDLEPIRFVNLILWNVIPLVLFFYLRKKLGNSKIPFVASMLTALSPIGILMGTTAQPEPLFTLLILLFIITFDNEKYYLSSILLGILCMLRYEAWALLAGLGIYYLIQIIRNKTLRISPNGKNISYYLNLFLPFLLIVIWTLLRYQSDGGWFSFLHGTHKFANDALGEVNSMQGGFWKFINDLFFYPFWIPFIFTGAAVILVPFGLRKFLADNKIAFIASLSILTFISISWVMKANLGLNRHFTSLVPFYSLLLAYGFVNVSDYMKKYKLFSSGKLLLSVFAAIILFYTSMWLYIWHDTNTNNFSEKRDTIEYLKQINSNEPNGIILCNDPMIEVLSGIDFKVFNHFWMVENLETKQYIESLKSGTGNIYIITSAVNESFYSSFAFKLFESASPDKNGSKILIFKY
ncbi:MAG: hypothetical protein WC139_10835 [Candidatus Kapaibacterium sp.]